MLFKVTVQETLTHEVYVEADTEEAAAVGWIEIFGCEDFDEVVDQDVEMLDIKEA